MTENVQTQIDKLAARLDEVERDTAWLHDRRVHDINGLQGNIGDLVLRVDELERPTPPDDETLEDRVKRLENQMALLGTPLPPPMTFTSGGTYTPPGDGDNEGDEPVGGGIRMAFLMGGHEPSPAPDEAALWGEVINAYKEQWEHDHGTQLESVYTSKVSFRAAVAKAIAIGLAAPADRSGVVVTDAMVDAGTRAYHEAIWTMRSYFGPDQDLIRPVIEAALRAELGEDDRGD